MNEKDRRTMIKSLMFITLGFRSAVNGDEDGAIANAAADLYVQTVGPEFATSPQGLAVMELVYGLSTLSGAILAQQNQDKVGQELVGLGLELVDSDND